MMHLLRWCALLALVTSCGSGGDLAQAPATTTTSTAPQTSTTSSAIETTTSEAPAPTTETPPAEIEVNFDRIVGTSHDGKSIFLESAGGGAESCGSVHLIRWRDGTNAIMGALPGDSIGSVVESQAQIAATTECTNGERYLTIADLSDGVLDGQTAQELDLAFLPEIVWSMDGGIAMNSGDEFAIPLPDGLGHIQLTPFDHPEGIGLEGGPVTGFLHLSPTSEEQWWYDPDMSLEDSEELARVFAFCPSIPQFSTGSHAFAIRDSACTDDFTTVLYGTLDDSGAIGQLESVTFDAEFGRATPAGIVAGPDAVSVTEDGSIIAWLATGDSITSIILNVD